MEAVFARSPAIVGALLVPESSHVYLHQGRLASNLAVEWIHPHDDDIPERWMGAIDL